MTHTPLLRSAAFPFDFPQKKSPKDSPYLRSGDVEDLGDLGVKLLDVGEAVNASRGAPVS